MDFVTPQNVELEEFVLGAIILESDCFSTVMEILHKDCFYKPEHAIVFSSIENLFKRKEAIDIITVVNELKSMGKLDAVGGAYSVSVLTNRIASSSNVEFHARIVLQQYMRRKMIEVSVSCMKSAYDDSKDCLDTLDAMLAEGKAIYDHISFGKIQSSEDLLVELMADIENTQVKGLSTGIKELDDYIVCLEPGLKYTVAGHPSQGKCLGKGTRLLMFDGSFKNVEDVVVGDKLMGDDSTERNVLSTTSGQEMMYWIKQKQGIDYRVNESHILSLKGSGTDGSRVHGKVVNISVKDYLNKSASFQFRHKGYKVGVDFKEKELPLDPYFIGLWLGDGTSSKSEVATQDIEIVEYLYEFAKSIGLQITKSTNLLKCPMYSITKGYKSDNQFSIKRQYDLKSHLRELNLLNNKHIPENYLINSKKNRLKLLAGLLDSDGYYNLSDHQYEITQTKKNLAVQIKFLADTLGFKTSINAKKCTIKSVGFVGTAYRVRINGNVEIIPVKIKRKIPRKQKNRRNWLVNRIEIEKDKVDNYYGFEIDGNKLFLLEDCTVTHNTSLAKTIGVNLINQGSPGIIFSMEMTEKQFMVTIVSGICDIDSERIRKKELTASEKESIWTKMKDFKKELLIIDGKSNVSPSYLVKRVKKAIKTHKIEWFIVDYTQMCKSDKKNQSKEERIGDFSQEIKSIAKTEGIIGIELAQLVKVTGDKESKRPQVSDIRDSGMIEASADCILLLYRPEHYGYTTTGPNKESTIGLAEIIVGKNRQGKIGSVLSTYIKEYTKFSDRQKIQHTSENNFEDNKYVF